MQISLSMANNIFYNRIRFKDGGIEKESEKESKQLKVREESRDGDGRDKKLKKASCRGTRESKLKTHNAERNKTSVGDIPIIYAFPRLSRPTGYETKEIINEKEEAKQ